MFEGIYRKIASPEWLAQHPQEEQPVQEQPVEPAQPVKRVVGPVQKTVTVTLDDNDNTSEITTATSSPKANEEMVQKIYSLLEKINKEGIDFFEVWDATEQMDGGITPSNIKNAFIALRAASGGKLTKDYVLETAQYYKEQIQTVLDADVKQKKTEKQQLSQKLSSEKAELQKEVDDYTKQIQSLTKQKEVAEQTLSEIDDKYQPQIQKIDQRITSGMSAVQTVVSEIQSYVDTFTKVIK